MSFISSKKYLTKVPSAKLPIFQEIKRKTEGTFVFLFYSIAFIPQEFPHFYLAINF